MSMIASSLAESTSIADFEKNTFFFRKQLSINEQIFTLPNDYLFAMENKNKNSSNRFNKM